jgi:hypothetical protein
MGHEELTAQTRQAEFHQLDEVGFVIHDQNTRHHVRQRSWF